MKPRKRRPSRWIWSHLAVGCDACSPVIWWARLCSIWLSWVWGCGPASQAVNDGVSEACSGALEQHKSRWAKPKGWAREGPAPLSLLLSSLAGAPLQYFSALLRVQTGKSFWFRGVGGGRGRKASFTWDEMRISGFFNSPWDHSGGKCQLPRGRAWLTMEFSSGFHSVSVGVEFIYEMMQQIGVQFLQAQFTQNILKKYASPCCAIYACKYLWCHWMWGTPPTSDEYVALFMMLVTRETQFSRAWWVSSFW